MGIIDEIKAGLRKPGKTKTGLAEALGRGPSAVTAILTAGKNGKPRAVKADEIEKIRAYFADGPVQEVVPSPDPEHPLDKLGPNTLPILGVTMGGRSDKRGPDFWLNGEIVRNAPRPRRLEGQKDVFGLFVDGTSMEPRYNAGDLIIVETRPPAPGDDVVIELKSADPKDESNNPSFIKQFVSRKGSTLTVRQFNPKKDLAFDLKEIKNLFRVIPTKELLG